MALSLFGTLPRINGRNGCLNPFAQPTSVTVEVTPASTKSRGKVSVGMMVAFVLWLGVVAGGTVGMIHYSNTPGINAQAPLTWPRNSQVPFDTHRSTLLMFMHPQCPCSKASLGELEILLAQFPRQLNANIIFLKPVGTVTNWEKADLWRKASVIPGVKVCTDNSGTEARRFHAETSGQTLLYDPSGALRFQGGITLGRGHAGDNPGRGALEELLRKGHSAQAKTPVFGCPLFDGECKKGDLTWKQ